MNKFFKAIIVTLMVFDLVQVVLWTNVYNSGELELSEYCFNLSLLFISFCFGMFIISCND